jgi:hypothetical protein
MEPISTPRRPGKFANVAKKTEEEIESVPMRPAMREEDSRSAAAKRAAQLREHLGEVVDGTDDFYIPEDVIPDGWTYEWKRHTIYGAEDPTYQVALLRSGWTPVPVSRHPEMMPHGTSTQTILRKGMILMECPTEIIQERKDDESRKARQQVRVKEQQLAGTPDGTMTRDHAKARPQIKKSYEAMPIPEK